jgi:hypothetical protein
VLDVLERPTKLVRLTEVWWDDIDTWRRVWPECGKWIKTPPLAAKIQAMTFSWYSCISPLMVSLYENHRLRKIMSGPNLAEPKQIKFNRRYLDFH